MNLLQIVCFEEANFILDHLRQIFTNNSTAKRIMAQHRDSHLGSQAIHLAAAAGNRKMIEVVIQDFEGDPTAKTSED